MGVHSFAQLAGLMIVATALVVGLSPARAATLLDAPNAGYEYVSPVPGSTLVSAENDVVLRTGREFAPAQVALLEVVVTGSRSGLHAGRLSLSDDDRTLVFEPDQPFAPGESVTVEAGKEHGLGLGLLPPLTFDFAVSPEPPGAFARLAVDQSAADVPEFAEALRSASEHASVDEVLPPLAPAFAVPSGYPRIQLITSHDPQPGVVFLTPFSNSTTLQPGNLTIVDDDLTPIYFKRLAAPSTDFKLLPNGRLAYYDELSPVTPRPQFVELDSSYVAVDSFATGNGYRTDSHDFELLPNGHALLLAYDPEPVRMDSIVPGGSPKAIVTGLIVQELDRAHRVVFQWRSWDHFAITDCNSPLVSLTGTNVDAVHGNAVTADLDGNLLISSRHLSEITKIDRRTGAILWRMGANAKNNQFAFVGDARGFSHQHDVRRLPNGDLMLFDNGNGVLPERSRAVEYQIDEANHVAREVWEYRHSPDTYGSFMGSVQRFENGGTLICWGGVTSGAGLTEIGADRSVDFELGFTSRQIWTYRAYRFPWRTTRFAVTPDTLDFGTATVDEAAIRAITLRNPGPAPITLNAFEFTGDGGFFLVDSPQVTLGVGESKSMRFAFRLPAPGTSHGKLTIAAVTDDERIALSIGLRGTAAHAGAGAATSPDAMRASAHEEVANAATVARLAARIANPARGLTDVRFTLPHAGRARLEIFGADGRRVATLADGEATAGEHVARWNPAGVPSGVYFCRLAEDGAAVVARVALIESR